MRVRHEDLHCLRLSGARFLDRRTDLCLQDIRFPVKPKQYLSNDYVHRVSSISMHISFEKRVEKMEAKNSKWLRYYDKNRENKISKSKYEIETCIRLVDGRYYTPDVLCSYQLPSQSPRVYCLELYNGRKYKDGYKNKVKYATDQLEKLLWIIDNTQKIEKKLQVEAVPRILCVCNNEKLLVSIQERIKTRKTFRVEYINQLIFFNLDYQVWEDFGSNRVNIDNEVVNLEEVKPICIG